MIQQKKLKKIQKTKILTKSPSYKENKRRGPKKTLIEDKKNTLLKNYNRPKRNFKLLKLNQYLKLFNLSPKINTQL